MAKTANLLVDGLGLAPGDEAVVVLPPHWQTLVVLAGCWAAGLHVVTDPTGAEQVTFTAESWTPRTPAPTGGEVVLLSLLPLGGKLRSPAEPGVIDYAAEVRTYGDRFTGPAVSPEAAAFDKHTQGDLVRAAANPPQTGSRVLISPADDAPLNIDLVVHGYLAPLTAGSVVLCRRADPAALPRRLVVERAANFPL